MPKVIKVALPGYNAETDTDPNHFSLFVDQEVDYILVKEKMRRVVSVSSETSVAHGLTYVPHCLVFAEVSTGVWRRLYSVALDGVGVWYEVDETNLVLKNTTGSAKDFSYQIFYDNIT